MSREDIPTQGKKIHRLNGGACFCMSEKIYRINRRGCFCMSEKIYRLNEGGLLLYVREDIPTQ